MLYSLDSFTTLGASDLLLAPEWRLMGALEAADGMLLFGISTALLRRVSAGYHRDGAERGVSPLIRGDPAVFAGIA